MGVFLWADIEMIHALRYAKIVAAREYRKAKRQYREGKEVENKKTHQYFKIRITEINTQFKYSLNSPFFSIVFSIDTDFVNL